MELCIHQTEVTLSHLNNMNNNDKIQGLIDLTFLNLS